MYRTLVNEVRTLLNRVTVSELRKNHKLKRKTKKVLILTNHLETLVKQKDKK